MKSPNLPRRNAKITENDQWLQTIILSVNPPSNTNAKPSILCPSTLINCRSQEKKNRDIVFHCTKTRRKRRRNRDQIRQCRNWWRRTGWWRERWAYTGRRSTCRERVFREYRSWKRRKIRCLSFEFIYIVEFEQVVNHFWFGSVL